MPSLVSIILGAILAADVVWWRRADWRARQWRHALGWRLAIALFVGGQMALVVWILGGRLFGESSLRSPPQLLSAAAYLWHLVVLPGWLVLVMIVRILFRLWHRAQRLASQGAFTRRALAIEAAPAALPGLTQVAAVGVAESATRRHFLGMATIMTPALFTGGGAAYSQKQLREFRVRSLQLAPPTLPLDLDGLRIAVVADLHVGTFTNGRTVKRIVEQTSRLNADLVLLPGDLINYALSDLSDALDAVCNMQSRHGAYLCVGNHDLIEDGAEFIRRTRARVPLLVNESRMVSIRGHQVQLLGVPWSRDDGVIAASVGQLASQVSPGAFPILMAHHPHAFDAAAASGFPLTVSGHTHGGQLMLTDNVGFGPLMFRYWSGLYHKPDGATLVVSNGVGNWLPLRLNAPAEIIVLTLHAGAMDCDY
jgi:predicted MPP superfamily phosphohydrolase